MLGRFGLPGELAVRKMDTLSGGEKSRVVFVELGLSRSHILLLDEPTNHLDLETIDCLIEGINEFEGGVVIVTHNMQLIKETCQQIWVVGETTGEITVFDGDIEDYRHEIEEELHKAEKVAEIAAQKRLEAKKLEREEKLKKIAEEKKNRAAKPAADGAASSSAAAKPAADAAPAPSTSS
eukprot:comp9971_c0_seq1/m.11754 comp9971_c0_seq1/g.11754  ORF comp9971_c0_seq1/g.11754 comp9971_c0_seq1/m.11754 type:complete len:180 (-) comp9971_c0_seq1:23-562(-)